MKKILIIIVILILLSLIGYISYQRFYQPTTLDDLINQQTKDINQEQQKLEKIIKETDFNPQTATPQEVINKLDKLEDID